MSRAIYLLKGKEKPLQRFHPWVFSGAIASKPKNLKDGDVVEVFSFDKQFLGIGHFHQSSIAVRILSFEPVEIDVNFFVRKLSAAYQLRQQILPENTNCYRLIHGEGDGLSGLVIDIYNTAAIIQCHTIGMQLHLPLIKEALQIVFSNSLSTIFSKSVAVQQQKQQFKDEFLLGSESQTIVQENNLQFIVNWAEGQKTGFFIDQRNNRELLKAFTKDKVVLNTFCYTGGFSVYALAGGAKEVHSVDVSEKAIELTNRNVALNPISVSQRHTSFCQDAFEFLTNMPRNQYEVIILDPPAFAKNISAKHNAIQAYKRINSLAIKNIKQGGIIFTFSCSQVVDKQLFFDTVVAAALETKRSVKVLHFLSQAPDHPINMFHSESEYLKGLVLFVE